MKRRIDKTGWMTAFLLALVVAQGLALYLGQSRGAVPAPCCHADNGALGMQLILLVLNAAALALRPTCRVALAIAPRNAVKAASAREQFRVHLDQALAHRRAGEGPVLVYVVDLAHFRNINVVLGQEAGDLLLEQVAARLRRLNGGAARVERIGGDKFGAYIARTGEPRDADFAHQILADFEEPYRAAGNQVDLRARIGIAAFPAHGADAHLLLAHAEAAMYRAKKTGKTELLYNTGLDHVAPGDLFLLSDLRRAVECDELALYVQPQIRLDTGAIAGLEALVRWRHPADGLRMPEQFIPFAEQNGVVGQVTLWMLDRTARLCAHLQARGTPLHVSVNLSARDLADRGLPRKIGAILTRHKVSPSAICLEITESALIEDADCCAQVLRALRTMGLRLSLDDFGTGYATLTYLKRFAVDELKIDRSFVLNMARDDHDATIVRSLIGLAHAMELQVVAEGIETATVCDLLRVMGCDRGQGYAICAPIPCEQIGRWLTCWEARPASA
jgi:diguanylate cyclase